MDEHLRLTQEKEDKS